jgi:hypothetical protein
MQLYRELSQDALGLYEHTGRMLAVLRMGRRRLTRAHVVGRRNTLAMLPRSAIRRAVRLGRLCVDKLHTSTSSDAHAQEHLGDERSGDGMNLEPRSTNTHRP